MLNAISSAASGKFLWRGRSIRPVMRDDRSPARRDSQPLFGPHGSFSHAVPCSASVLPSTREREEPYPRLSDSSKAKSVAESGSTLFSNRTRRYALLPLR